MADNVTLNAGAGGDTIAADDISSAKYQRIKLVHGADGVNAGDVAIANGLPVQPASGASFTVDTELPAAGALADNTANPTTSLVGGCLMGFDGTTWDRIYTIADGDALNANTKGFLILGHDGANYQVPLVDSSGRLYVNINGTPAVTITSGNVTADTELPAAAALADAAANPTTPLIGGCLLSFNGTTWDRLRGDTTNGLDVDVTRLPALAAGTNLIGQVAASAETGTIYSGTTALTPKFAKISCSSNGENTLVSLVSSKKIRVHAIALFVVGTAISIYFKDGAGGAAIFADGTNPIPVDKTGAAGAGGFVLGYNPLGWFQSASGSALILNLSGAQAVAGGLLYSEV